MVIKNKSHITIDCSTLTWLFWISNFKGLFHITVNLNFHKLGFWNFFQLKAFTASKEISSQLFKMYWCTNHDISGFNCLSWSFIFHYVICMIYWFQKHCLHNLVPLSILLALIDFHFHSVIVWVNIQFVLKLHDFLANTRIHAALRNLKKQLYKERYFIKFR